MDSEIYSTQGNTPSIGHIVRALPSQYWAILMKPSTQTFENEKQKATWASTWWQLIGLTVISAILVFVASQIAPPQLTNVSGVNPATLRTTILVLTVVITLIATPITFLLAGGVFCLVARLFKGNGTYKQQMYTLVLLGVPFVLLSDLLLLIPATSSWLPYIPHLYALVLSVFMLKGVHNLSTGRAIATLLLPAVVLLLLVIAGSLVIASLFMHA